MLVLLTALVSCAGAPEQAEVSLESPLSHDLTIVYSGNLDGELEPCGCSEGGNKGGIKRRVNKIDELRAADPDLVLISAGGLLVSELAQDKLKSEYILKGLATLDYDAMGVQWRDLAYGPEFLAQHTLPWVASNGVAEGIASHRLIERAGVRIAVFQWLTPEDDPAAGMATDTLPLEEQLASLTRAIQRAKAEGAITWLNTTLSLKQAQRQMPLAHLDVLVQKAKYEKYGEPQWLGKTLVLQPGSRGMRLGRMTLRVSREGLELRQHEVIPLPPEVGDAERMEPWYTEYNAKVKEAYEARTEIMKARRQGASPYAGEKVCQACHSEAYKIWYDSRHAEAFYALQDVNKAFDPDCIGCHTVGFEQAGGFIDPDVTPELLHVQCESCHGPAKAHADTAGKTPVANQGWTRDKICGQCHVQKHSPDFDFAGYWPKIAHGR